MKPDLRAVFAILGALLIGSIGFGQSSPIEPSAAPPRPTADPPWSAMRVAGYDSAWHTLYERSDARSDPTIDLQAVGDIMLGRSIAALAHHQGYDYPFRAMGRLLDGDFTVGNIESPLTDRRDQPRSGPYRLPAPNAFAPALQTAGFDALSLANNHALDAGPAGLQNASRSLEQVRIQPLGVGADLIIGSHPHVLQPIERVDAGDRSGLVAYSLGNFVFDQEHDPATSTGAILRFTLDRRGVARIGATPITIVRGQPQPLAADDPQAQRVLAHLSADLPTTMWSAWQWDGASARAVAVPPNTPPQPRPQRLLVDLRGDGQPLLATLDERGLVEVRDGSEVSDPIVWRNEAADWRVTRIDRGDPNCDGRIELVLLLWKPDRAGVLRSHPFLMGWRGGHYRIVWGGSATPTAIGDLAVGDLDGDGWDELVVLQGGDAPGDPARFVSIWRWHGWGFELAWRSQAGTWRELWLADVTGDGRVEIVVGSS